jgi:hypothetical protein
MIMSLASRLLFTVSRIAQAMGCTRQNIHQQLASIAADGEQMVKGQRVKTWRVSSLPPIVLRDLADRAQLKRYPSVVALLSEPFRRYESSVPFAEVAAPAREKALKLERALRPLIEARNAHDASSADFVNRGVAEYQRTFGYTITGRHWRALFDRTIERDNGNEEWHHSEIYLEENPARISTTRPVAIARERGLEVMEDAMAELAGVRALSVQQKTFLWMKACDELQLQLANGGREKRVKRAILKTLVASRLLGADKESVRRNLNRQWSAYCANAGKLVDLRTRRDVRETLPEHDRNKIVARSLDCGGRVSQAFRELRDDGELSSETLSKTIANPRSKSYMPASVRREVSPEIARLMPLHRGEREFELSGPYVPQDFTLIAAGQVMQLDDVTLPVYYWENDPEAPSGVFFGRGQWILAIDVRSMMALGHALHSSNVYNMRMVRSLLLRIHDTYGLPESLLLERGMWRTAKIMKGDELDLTHTEQGLREFGVSFHHRTKPRGKIIERVIGLVQNQMERVAGYAGRNERDDRYERVQEQIREVQSGREHPSKYFLSKTEWLQQLDSILLRYNHEAQNGNLKASPAEAWNANLLEAGTVNLGAKARYLLAHHKKPVKVQPRGIRLPASLGGGLYYNTVTGRFAGEQMLAWINPDELEAIVLTSLDRRDGPFIVERADALAPIGASNADLNRAHAQIAAHNSYARTQYRVIQDGLVRRQFRRLAIVDKSTIELGEKVEAQTLAAKGDREKLGRVVRKAQSSAREAGLNVRVTPKNAERTAAAADLLREVYSEEKSR